MLFASRSRSIAVSVPLLFGSMFVGFAYALSLYAHKGVSVASISGAVVTMALGLLSATQLRMITRSREHLVVRNLLGRKFLKLSEVAFGVRVHHSHRGGATYTVYALDQDGESSLTEAASRAGSERLKRRLEEIFLVARLSGPTRSEVLVGKREMKWQRDAQEAEAARRYGPYSPRLTLGVGVLIFLAGGIGVLAAVLLRS